MKTAVERFIEYVKHNTKSDENSQSVPSSKCQMSFAKFLARELNKIGLENVSVDKNGYVMAFISENEKNMPSIGFIAHMDTSPEASGENVVPTITKNYDGNDIKLNGTTLSPKMFPELNSYKGETIITSDGTTLLGADDKAGISEIISAMEYIVAHPEIKHGKIAVAFTPDEEIGRGADHFDVASFGCDFAYTMDGGKIGELEYENFNAARAKIAITGVSVHPGTAKGVMKNAALIGCELVSMLPLEETPSNTCGYEGFYHIVSFDATVSKCNISCIIRDFDKHNFERRKEKIQSIVSAINKKYPRSTKLELYDEYYNMFEKVSPRIEIIELAKAAMEKSGVKPIVSPIRGGTDGARLSFMGLPCPNIFAGGHNFHGTYEFIPASSIEKATEVIINIIKLSGSVLR